MNSRRVTLAVVAAVAVAVGVAAAQPSRTTGESSPREGRFQLFQAHFKALDFKNNRVDDQVAVFLLDSASGKVSRYSTGLSQDGNSFERWVPTN
jgi:hypothetical protein